ncbi:MAG: hypothetical protein ACYCOU_14655 [Sulfobacillus sp.]
MTLPFKVPRAGAIAMLVAGILYTVLSLPHLFASAASVPVATRFVASGNALSSSDVSQSRISLHAISFSKNWVLKEPVVPGEVITPALLTPMNHVSGVLVAVTPSFSEDMAVATPGSEIQIVLILRDGRTWRSPTEQVLSAPGASNLLGSNQSAILVRLPMKDALSFMKLSSRAQIFLIGVSP